MNILLPVRRMRKSCDCHIRKQLEFCGLLLPSSTALWPLECRFEPRLTCVAQPHTLPHQAMPTSPYSTIQQLVESIRTKAVSPVEIVETHLQRIEKCQPKLNAFVHLDVAAARHQARAAEAAVPRGAHLAPLHGVPLTIKSCIDVAGWPCPAGSLLRKEYVPNHDAPLVLRLKDAGAILLGNTNTPEFLMAYESDNLLTGKTSNPWNLAYSAGGSSGGEAAAIAAGCSVGGVGSDGGGSIRVPAHFCGICGLKPTPGRIPSTGHFPAGAGAFSWLGVVGPMARTIADLRLLFDVMAGPDAGDALSLPIPSRIYSQSDLRGLRIGILESDTLGAATPETRSAVGLAATLLAEKRFIVEPFDLTGLDRALELWWFFFGPVIGHLIRQSAAGQEGQLSPILREYLSHTVTANPITLNQFMKACTDRDLLRAEILRQMQNTPILLSPVSSTPAFRHGEGNYAPVTGYRDTMRYSQWLNLTGFPGASVPLGLSTDGLPVGVQIIGRPFEDELVLSVAEALETARGPWQPPSQCCD
jgi:Asp-tRNA(Asn)/Glu-tRNA(Gln) amidotransferase A subunit family amidase